jgi:integrase
MDISNDQYFKQWVRSRNIRKTTIQTYYENINKYCLFLDKTPTQLIQINQPWMSDRRINQYLLDFQDHMKNYSFNYLKNTLTIVKFFYRHFEIQLPQLILKNQDSKTYENKSKIPNQDDIRLALKNCSIKYQSIILLMSSSGMGRGEIQELQVQDFINALDYKGNIGEINTILNHNDNDLIGTWNIHRKKNLNPMICFNSPESTRTIIEYLQKCRRNIKPDEPLFLSQRRNKISDSAFESQFSFINDRSGFGWSGKHRFFTSHQLRRFFGTTLIKNRVPEIFAEWFLGHKIDPNKAAYFKEDSSALKQEYLRVLPYLVIKEKLKVNELTTDDKAEFEAMKKQLAAMQRQIDRDERFEKLP